MLAAATAAAKEGRALSAAERAAAERPILFPEEVAAEQAARRAAEEQVTWRSLSFTFQLVLCTLFRSFYRGQSVRVVLSFVKPLNFLCKVQRRLLWRLSVSVSW